MEINLSKEFLLFVITFLFSIIGGITGIGIATIINPLMIFLGFPFPFAKATALWINVSIMSLTVWKKGKTVKWNLAIPLVVSSFLFAPIGAKISFFIPERVQLLILASFVVFSGLLILKLKPKPRVSGLTHWGFVKLGIILGAFAGFIGGMLGIGGGIIANPVLIILGFDPVMVSAISASMVLFSSLSGWIVYTAMGHFSPRVALPLFFAAIGGSYIGNLLSEKFERNTVRKVVAYFAIFVGFITALKAFTL